MFVLGAWLLFGFIAGIIGSRKGAGCASFLWGFLLGPFGILIAIFRKGDTVTCPYCKENIRKDALVCKHCGQSLIASKEPSRVRTAIKQKAETQVRSSPPPIDKGVSCPHCSQSIPISIIKAGKNFCPHCGSEYNAE